MRWSYLLGLVLALACARLIIAQSSDNATPLGDVVKKSESSKKESKSGGPPKAKHIFTDDDMSVRKIPIPTIALKGAENTEELLAAIHEYRAGHSVEETENVVHAWFDEQNGVLIAAIEANTNNQKHNQLRMETAQDSSSYPYNYNYDGDYSKLNERQTAERWSQRVETRSTQENYQVISRIQQAFMKVRNDVICHPNRTRSVAYDWFKIRTANGVNSY